MKFYGFRFYVNSGKGKRETGNEPPAPHIIMKIGDCKFQSANFHFPNCILHFSICIFQFFIAIRILLVVLVVLVILVVLQMELFFPTPIPHSRNGDKLAKIKGL
jgi:hypothetical protein